jgi:hypothetical protein
MTMLNKSKPTVADLRAEHEMQAGLIRAAQSQIADVLRAGGDTSALRQEIGRRTQRLTELTLLMADAAGDRAERDAELVGLKASKRAAKVRAEIAGLLAALAAPQRPHHA